MIRFNQLQPPFNNPAIRRALLGAISQEDTVTAVVGTDQKMWNVPVGYLLPEHADGERRSGSTCSPAPRDMDKVKRELKAAGYKGEKVVLLAATDFPVLKAMSDVAADALKRAGHERGLRRDRLGHAWSRAGPRRSRWTRAAGARSAPPGPGPTRSTRPATSPARQRRAGLVRLAERPEARAAARRSGSRRPTSPAQAAICAEIQQEALRLRAVHPDGPIPAADRLPHQSRRRAERVRDLLECARRA